MNRSQFVHLKFPNLPYCEFKITKGLSSEFYESFHIKNDNTGIQLNFLWRNDEKISVGITYTKEKNKFKQFDTILNTHDKFNQEIVTELCNKYLKGE